jgi:hypothetical protein
VKSVKYLAVALTLSVAVPLAVSACGGDDSTTTVTQNQTEQTQPTSPTTTTATTTPTTTGSTTSTSTTATTSTASGPGACGPDQAFSQVSNTCVNTRSGNNPCPPGEVPMADRPVCVAKDGG